MEEYEHFMMCIARNERNKVRAKWKHYVVPHINVPYPVNQFVTTEILAYPLLEDNASPSKISSICAKRSTNIKYNVSHESCFPSPCVNNSKLERVDACNAASIIKIQDKCRFCLSETQNSVNINEQNQFNLKRVCEMANIRIQNNDELTTKICNICIDKARMMLEFLRKISETDTWLHRQLVKRDEISNYDMQIEQHVVVAEPWPIAGAVKVMEENHVTKNNNISRNLKVTKTVLLDEIQECEKKITSISICPDCNGKNCLNCHECNIKFSTEKLLEKHQMMIHISTCDKKRVFLCHICSKSYTNKNSLDLHLQRHDLSTYKSFNCRICNRIFASESQIRVHMKHHLVSKELKCILCNFTFIKLSQYAKHVNTMHREGGNQFRPCDSSNCRRTKKRKCNLITEEDTKNIMKQFWNLSSITEQKLFILNHIKSTEPATTCSSSIPRKRHTTNLYFLPISTGIVQVCRKTFANSLNLPLKTLSYWLEKRPIINDI